MHIYYYFFIIYIIYTLIVLHISQTVLYRLYIYIHIIKCLKVYSYEYNIHHNMYEYTPTHRYKHTYHFSF